MCWKRTTSAPALDVYKRQYFYGTGRRKDSVARVRVYTGTGKITINDRDVDNYFGLETLKLIVRSPLFLLGLELSLIHI